MQSLAREAEAAGFEAVFASEGMNDALANCMLMAQATSRIKVGTWIANIYLRHPSLCAETAVAIDYASKGRLILGLGVSHRAIVEGIYNEKMDRPRETLRRYVDTVRTIVVAKTSPGTEGASLATASGVPLYIGALTLGTVELAGDLADGVMLFLCSKQRLVRVKEALAKGAAKAGREASRIDLTTGLPAFVSDDLRAAKKAAKNSLLLYGQLSFYIKLFQNSGFREEAAMIAAGNPGDVPDRMIDELMLCGPPSRCREQLAAFREAGIDLPIITPGVVGEQSQADAVRKVIEILA